MTNTDSNEYHTARKAVAKVKALRELELLRSIINEMLNLKCNTSVKRKG